jgi:SAM-dependent methyltransferase
MKLSELIDFRNKLNEHPVSEVQQATDSKLDVIMYQIQMTGAVNDTFLPDLQLKYDGIHHSIAQFDQSIDQLKTWVNGQIEEQEKYWFQESYRFFEKDIAIEPNETILGRQPSRTVGDDAYSTAQAERVLRARLLSNADWRFPGMVIRPGKDTFIEDMVSHDPLYLLDKNYDLLKPALELFPEQYRARMRPYLIDDLSDRPILEKIPNDQFGVCLAYNYFNYRPLELIRKYLTEIYQKLRPGGYLIMTFNDCDKASAVQLVENHFACYTPGSLVRELAINIGYNLSHEWSDGGPSVWLELRKVGTLKSLRGGQAIAKIRTMEEIDYDVDFLKRKAYTKEEIERMKTKARNYGVGMKTIEKLLAQSPLDLQELLNELWAEQQESLERARLEEIRQIEEAEKRRIEELKDRARTLGIDPDEHPEVKELVREIGEAEDKIRKQELADLRKRAMDLNLANPNLIRYGYSAEKLRQLIKEKEEETE